MSAAVGAAATGAHLGVNGAAVFPGVLSAVECAEAIASAEARGFESMGRRYPKHYRSNDRALLDDAALAEKLFERLRPHLPSELDEDGTRWRLQGLNTRFRFCRYRDGQQFTKHRDGAWAREAGERSWLTVMLYLNDAGEFAGGATRFYVGDAVEAVAPRVGQAIVFDHRLWHDGEAVSAGVKYVMRTDVMYRREQAGTSTPLEAQGVLSQERLCTGHAGYAWVVRKLTDGRLVSGSRDCTVRSWGTGEVLRADLAGSPTAIVEVEGRLWVGGRHGRIDDGGRSWQAHDGVVLGLERMTDGSVVSCGADGVILRWSPTGEAMGEVSRHGAWVWGIASDGRAAVDPVTAIAIGAQADRDGVIRLDDGRSWMAHAGAVTGLASLAGGRWASCGEDGAVKVWSSSGALLGAGGHRDFVRCLTVIDDTRFATASYDGTVGVWRVSGNDGALRQSLAADH